MNIVKRTRIHLFAVVFMLSAGPVLAQGSLIVSNVTAGPRPGTTLIDATYDLETVGGLPVTVSLFLSTDAGATYPFICRTVSGNVGAGTLPGLGNQIVWNAGTDFPGFSSTTCKLRVIANDSAILADFVYISPGGFDMGSPDTEPGRNFVETQHSVTIANGYYIHATEVTNQQYVDMVQWAYDMGFVTATSLNVADNLDGSTVQLLNLNAGGTRVTFTGGVFSTAYPDEPLGAITWFGAVAYCDWLSLLEVLPRAYDHSNWQCNANAPYSAVGYRLATEAEWEYACRAGSTTALANGPITELFCGFDANLDLMGWYCGNASGSSPLVATKNANAWGVYDMHGTVFEWCNDYYALYESVVVNPSGPDTGSERVYRSGSMETVASACRSAFRAHDYPSFYSAGIRPVRSN